MVSFANSRKHPTISKVIKNLSRIPWPPVLPSNQDVELHRNFFGELRRLPATSERHEIVTIPPEPRFRRRLEEEVRKVFTSYFSLFEFPFADLPMYATSCLPHAKTSYTPGQTPRENATTSRTPRRSGAGVFARI